MKSRYVAAMLMVTLAGSAYAQRSGGGVYLCIDAQGNKEYRNKDITKNCKKLDLPGLTTVPASKAAPAANGKKPDASASANGKKPDSSPGGFPKVDEKAQKSRDSDRKQILQEELRQEEEKLARLKAEYKGGEPDRLGDEKNYAKYQERTAKLKEDVERSEKNVDALKREIANLK